jgi:hypothetical protein
MGKKSRRPNRSQSSTATTATVTGIAQQQRQQPLSSSSSSPSTTAATNAGQQQQQQQQQQQPPIMYTSDGPSDVELLQTRSASLQAKLDQLTALGLANDRKAFVEQFVPLDLSPSDAAAYLEDLTTAPEAEGQWNNLISEIAAIRCGKGVQKIDGDQITRAVFYFTHPLLEQCDREVAFVCTNGHGEWRAEG